MATNKNAQLRYKALDQCFSNFYKKFYIDDLIEFCSKVLSDHYAKSMSVSRRQIFDDIDFMKSEAGFEAPIEPYKQNEKAEESGCRLYSKKQQKAIQEIKITSFGNMAITQKKYIPYILCGIS